MTLNKKVPRVLMGLALVAMLVPFASARAQTNKEQAPAVASQKAETPSDTKPASKTETDERAKTRAESVEQLKTKVDQLQSLVEQQQRLLNEMQKRLDDVDGRTRTAIAPAAARADASNAVNPSPPAPDLRPASVAVNPVPTASTAATQTKPEKPVAGWDKDKGHAFLRSSDGAFEALITGYGQFDFRGYQSGDHPPNTFLVRRARLAVEGKLERYFDFKIEGDFADTASTLLRDFYINIHRIDEFQLRFGQYKEPYSQEEIRADIYQDFVERSLVNNLAPSRSPGLMALGSVGKGVFEYQLGSFNGKGLLALNNNGTPESVLRLRFAPWKNTKSFLGKGLFFGGAVAQGRSFGGTSVRGLTESRSFTYFTPDTVNGKIIRTNGELTWLLGPATIRAEYDQTNQDRENLGVGGRNLPGVVAKGFMAQATYLLTGENKPDAGTLAPRHSLFGDEGGTPGFGAWELKFRYADLQIADGTAKSNRAQTFTFGPNWYLNRYVKYLLDLGVEHFKDPLRTPRPGDKNYFVILSRIQVAF
jgi:phosphate-selective porin OprO/OprP